METILRWQKWSADTDENVSWQIKLWTDSLPALHCIQFFTIVFHRYCSHTYMDIEQLCSKYPRLGTYLIAGVPWYPQVPSSPNKPEHTIYLNFFPTNNPENPSRQEPKQKKTTCAWTIQYLTVDGLLVLKIYRFPYNQHLR